MNAKIIKALSGLALSCALAWPVFAHGQQTLSGHLPAAVARFNLRPMHRLSATTNLTLLIGLPLRNQPAFSNQLSQLYSSTSPQFHHWLTPKQIATKYGPSEEDYQNVIAWAKSNGLTITATHDDHLLLRVSGAVSDVENSLHVKMQVYQHPAEARTFYAPDTEPTPDLAVPLLHITGLDNFHIPHSNVKHAAPPVQPLSQGGSAPNSAPSGPKNSFWGNDFRSVYAPGTSLNGSGQTMGLLELDNFFQADINTYIHNSGVSTSTSVVVTPVDGGFGPPGSGDNEVSLDIEMAVAMAPGLSKILVYEAPNNGSDWVDILKRMQEDDSANTLSSSWSVYDDANADTYYLLFAMQGQSFFQSSGDDGAYFNGIYEWTDDPNVTIVGGSYPFTTSSGGWSSETTWQGSGGGISASYLGNFSIPAWQQPVSMSANGGSTSKRNVPDVAMVAAGIYTVFSNNVTDPTTGGTSASAPLWAAFTALANQQAVSSGQPTLGFLNPAFYAIGLGPNYNTCLHDINDDSNNANGTNSFTAVTGYDLCTGWGSPNGTNLMNALMPYTGAIWVDFNYGGSLQNGSYVAPYKTMASGISAVPNNGNIWIRSAGSSSETMTISKPLTIRAANGPGTIGN